MEESNIPTPESIASEAQKDIANLSSHLMDLIAYVSRQQGKYAQVEDENVRLINEKSEAQKKFEALSAKKNELSQEKDRLLGEQLFSKTELNRKDERITDLNEEIAKKNTEISDLKNNLMEKNEKISKLEQTLEEKNSDLDGRESKINEILSQKNELESQLVHLKENLEKTGNSLTEAESKIENLAPYKDKVEEYESLKFNKLKEAYSLFKAFKNRTRENLKNVFITETFLGFISQGMQWENIVAVWEQASRKIINDDPEDAQELRTLFLLLFEIYNSGYDAPPYTLITPEIGAKYNSSLHRIKNNKSDGKVAELLLEGYVVNKNNASHKALILAE